ncbi:hypothetical protein DF024_30515 [Burkholderia cenocepacia]|nr:hypothetical protein DF024_30515 [Burkholderia cenocepacia]
MPCHVKTLLGTALHGTARKSDIARGRRFRSVSRFATARLRRRVCDGAFATARLRRRVCDGAKVEEV